MQILMCAQGTPDWVDARLGLVTGSNAKRIITPKTMKYSEQSADYAAELVAEKLTGGIDPWKWEGETQDMQRGKANEGESRLWYQVERDVDVEQIGLAIHDNGRWAVSPDGLVGETGGLELKNPAPRTQVRWLADGVIPAEHLPQVHHALIVTGREWWDFMSYCRSLPPLLVRITPNEFTAKLREYLDRFTAEVDALQRTIEDRLQSHIDSEIDRRAAENPTPIRSFVA